MITETDYETHIVLVRGVLNREGQQKLIDSVESIVWRGTASTAGAAPTRQVGSISIEEGTLDAAFDSIFPATFRGSTFFGLSYERVAIANYKKGDSFKLHADAVYAREEGIRSAFSILIYLNDDFQGGETAFPDLRRVVRPEAGTAIVFGHTHRHAGRPVLSDGVKYALHLFALYKDCN